jgi:hypothetical protein
MDVNQLAEKSSGKLQTSRSYSWMQPVDLALKIVSKPNCFTNLQKESVNIHLHREMFSDIGFGRDGLPGIVQLPFLARVCKFNLFLISLPA